MGGMIPFGGRFGLRLLVAVVATATQAVIGAAEEAEPGWAADWAVTDGLSLSLDTSGYDFPSAIAVVPEPGDGPGDPIYFVTEIRGTVKVVTNDRSVHIFAAGVTNLHPEAELPEQAAEVGMAGICLDPAHGYVFVTYAYTDDDGVIRNNVTRFETAPGRFSLEPAGRLDFTEIFAGDVAEISHQVGPCQVDGDALYVSVGNGEDNLAGRRLDSTLGKILRMTFDGEPHPGNPFRSDGEAIGPADYVWAYGLRNPFSLRVVEGRVLVADNGPGVDNIFEASEGEDYKFDGSDWSIGLNAGMVFSPAVSPVGMDFQGPGEGLAPLYDEVFYLALAGGIRLVGPGVNGSKSIVAFAYDFARRRIVDVPEKVVEYRGKGLQIVAGVGVAGDGLYFVPMLADESGTTAIYKVAAEPGRAHPYLIGADLDAAGLIASRNCYGCHRVGGIGVAPDLARPVVVESVSSRLTSQDYRERVADLEPAARADVDAILGLDGEARVRAWIVQQIDTPGFDNPESVMPDLDLNAEQAVLIADHLLGREDQPSAGDWLFPLMMIRRQIYGSVMGLAVGLLLGAGLASVAYLVAARRRRPPATG